MKRRVVVAVVGLALSGCAGAHQAPKAFDPEHPPAVAARAVLTCSEVGRVSTVESTSRPGAALDQDACRLAAGGQVLITKSVAAGGTTRVDAPHLFANDCPLTHTDPRTITGIKGPACVNADDNFLIAYEGTFTVDVMAPKATSLAVGLGL